MLLIHRPCNLRNSHDPTPLHWTLLIGPLQEKVNHELGDIYLVVQRPPELYAVSLVSRAYNRLQVLRCQHPQRVHPQSHVPLFHSPHLLGHIPFFYFSDWSGID